MKIKKIIFLTSFLMGMFLVPFSSYSQESNSSKPKLIIFHSFNCHSCIKVKKEIMPEIEKKFKDKIIIEYRDIADIENYKLLLSLQEKHKIKLSNDLPIFYFGGGFLNREAQISRKWEPFLARSLPITGGEKAQAGPQIDLISRFKDFRLFTIVSAGLIDGINPCAFTVIVFFISFLVLQGYKRKELIAIGLCFIFAVFLTYLLLGLGLFSFLYRINGFWLITKTVNLLIGIFSIILGIFAVFDFIKFKKTGTTEGLTLQLPQSIKNQIHKVVGLHYRVDKKSGENNPGRPLFKLILSALITGFLISLLEAVCTGQTYLPTITFILKTAPDLQLQAFGYLLLYNIMFTVPLLIIFIFALLGVTTEQFSDFLKSRLPIIKILMAILFFGLGIFLVLRA